MAGSRASWDCQRVIEFNLFWVGFYSDQASLEISVNSRIALPFSRQIAIGNAGPV